jgi:tetratricopeptide (TPR) repeat protein
LEAATSFLLERTDRRRQKAVDDDRTAYELAASLGGLALALEQAGAYISKGEISFARYQEIWRDNWSKVAEWADETITKYPRALSVAWQTSEKQLSARGRHLLVRLAWLAPEPIPNSLIDIAASNMTAEQNEEALIELSAYSFVRRNSQRQEFSVHRLVQDVIRRGLEGEERRNGLVEALSWLNAAFPSEADNVSNWPKAEPLAPHVLAVTEYANGAGIPHDVTASLVDRLGLLFRSKALYREAEPLFRRAVELREGLLGTDAPDTATSLSNLGRLYLAQGRLGEARTLFERALNIRETVFGPEHPETAISLNNLGVLLQEQGDLEGARPLKELALQIREKAFGIEHPRTTTSLISLALLMQADGKFQEARPLFERALDIRTKILGPEHPETATSLNDLAVLLRSQGDFAAARPLFERALKIRQAVLGPEHPDTATSFNDLGELFRSQGDLAVAGPLFERALGIREKALGSNHQDTKASFNDLFSLLQAQGDSAAQRKLFDRALAIGDAAGIDK